MKDKLAYSIALSLLAGFAVSASAEVIDLFDAMPITNSADASPNESAAVDINNNRFVYDSAETTVFCAGPGTAYLRTVGDANNHLIVDNYVTLNDADTQSICAGGSSINGNGSVITSGTHCFDSGSSSSGVRGAAIDTVFNSDATAPVQLSEGWNDLLFKLWDYGAVFGNTALELALPESCSSEPPTTTTNLCAAQDTDIGNVNVWNDSEHLYVEFEITEQGWYLEETHVAVGFSGDMTNKGGNPRPGRFPYECESLGEQETSCMIKIPFGEEKGEINFLPDDFVDIAAHAVAYQLEGDGCDEEFFYAEEVVDANQGTLVGGGEITNTGRTTPDFGLKPDGDFFSLGFNGSLTVGFGDRIYNGPGADVCAREVTNGRLNYPEEKAGVLIDDITPAPEEITNEGSSDDGGKACVGLPFDVISAESVTLFDTTDPTLFNGENGRLRSDADGYDVDWIAACYLANDETAWGGACPSEDGDAEGTRFTNRGNWGTYFRYEIR